MSIQVTTRTNDVPVVQHIDCHWQMTFISTIISPFYKTHLYQCDQCKTIAAVKEDLDA